MADIWGGLVVLVIFLLLFALMGLAIFVIWRGIKRSVGIKGKVSGAMDRTSSRIDESLTLGKESLELQKEMLEAQREMNRLLAELLRTRRSEGEP